MNTPATTTTEVAAVTAAAAAPEEEFYPPDHHMHPSHRAPEPAPSEEGGSQGEFDLTTSEPQRETGAEHKSP